MWGSIEVSKTVLVELLQGKSELQLPKLVEYDNLKVGDIVELYSTDGKLHQFVVITDINVKSQHIDFKVGLLPNFAMIDMFGAVDNIDDSADDMEMGLKLEMHKPKWLHDIFNKHNARLCGSSKLPQCEDSSIYNKLIKYQGISAKLKKYELLLRIKDESFEPKYFPDVKDTVDKLKAADYIAKIFENKSSFQIREDGDRYVIHKVELDNIAEILELYQKYCTKLDKKDQSLDDIISGLQLKLEPIKDRCEQEYEKWNRAVVETTEYIRDFKQIFERQTTLDYQGFDMSGMYKLTICEFREDGLKIYDSTITTMVAKTGKEFVQNLQICMGPDYDDEHYINRVWYDLKSNCYMVDIGRY